MRPVAPCSCGGDVVLGRFDRRHFMQIAGIAGLAASLPLRVLAAEGDYEAMLISCIDPRMVTPVYNYMEKRGFSGKYSQFVVAGAAIAVVAPKFETWRPAFWDNLATSVQLHNLTRVIRDRPPRLRRRPHRLRGQQHRQPADRDQDPPRGPGRVPRGGRTAPSPTHRRDRLDGPRRLDRDVPLKSAGKPWGPACAGRRGTNVGALSPCQPRMAVGKAATDRFMLAYPQ